MRVAAISWWCGAYLHDRGIAWGALCEETTRDSSYRVSCMAYEHGKRVTAYRFFSVAGDAQRYFQEIVSEHILKGFSLISSREAERYHFSNPFTHVADIETRAVSEPAPILIQHASSVSTPGDVAPGVRIVAQGKRADAIIELPHAKKHSAVATCAYCSAALEVEKKFCRSCGMPVYMEMLFHRYQLIRQVGKGGFGKVFLARDTYVNDRQVAVKQVEFSSKSEEEEVLLAQQFHSEMKLLAGLSHPNLPIIIDYRVDGATGYLVMSYIDGETLDAYLERNKGVLPQVEVCEIALELCGVLSFLHQQKPPIIFRDLKPLNVMRDKDGRLFLIDFGIARTYKPGQRQDTATFGSAGYSAPEQYGKAQTTPQSDIYSLGATMYTMLTGTDPANDPWNLRFAKGNKLDVRLKKLVREMTAFDSKDRPLSMLAAASSLEDILDHPVQKKQAAKKDITISVVSASLLMPPKTFPYEEGFLVALPSWLEDSVFLTEHAQMIVESAIERKSQFSRLSAVLHGASIVLLLVTSEALGRPEIVDMLVREVTAYCRLHNTPCYSICTAQRVLGPSGQFPRLPRDGARYPVARSEQEQRAWFQQLVIDLEDILMQERERVS
jgi:serine/threonine protein kinase